MTKEEYSLTLFGGADDGIEDEVEFFGFLPEFACWLLGFRDGRHKHPQPVFGFARFFLADADFVFEVGPRFGVVGLTVVGTYARCRPD